MVSVGTAVFVACVFLAQPGPALVRSAVFAAPITLTVGLAVGAAVLAALSLHTVGSTRRKGLALAGWGLASLSFAVSGHAAVAPPRVVAFPAVSLHAAALVFWMGSPVPLLLALRGPERDSVPRRFPSIAVPIVVVLILSGVTLTWLQSGSPAALPG